MVGAVLEPFRIPTGAAISSNHKTIIDKLKSWVRNVPLAVQLLTYISDSCSREPFATEVAGILCFKHVARGHNPEPKPNTSGDGQFWGSPRVERRILRGQIRGQVSVCRA